MSDDEVIKRISLQVGVGLSLQLQSRFTRDEAKAERLHAVAQLFIRHSLMLIAAHKIIVERWMSTRPR